LPLTNATTALAGRGPRVSVQILASAHHRADTAVTYVQREEEGAGQAAAVEWPVGEARQAGTHEPAEQLLTAPPLMSGRVSANSGRRYVGCQQYSIDVDFPLLKSCNSYSTHSRGLLTLLTYTPQYF